MNGKLIILFMMNGGESMKKISVFLFFLFIVFLTGSCFFEKQNKQVANNDWSYVLPNGYVIWHINSNRIVCGKKDSQYSISNVGGNHVIKFCYNNQFVCLQCIQNNDTNEQKDAQITLDYYVINTIDDVVYGPLTENDYVLLMENMNLENITSWIATKPRPEGAQFS